MIGHKVLKNSPLIVMLSIPETIVSDNALFLVISDLSTISLVKINDWCLASVEGFDYVVWCLSYHNSLVRFQENQEVMLWFCSD
jgi:hypothetical protein